MTQTSVRGAIALCFLFAVTGGCKCGPTVAKRSPQMDLDGDRVDFGSVQVNQTHTRAFRVRNLGNASLNLSEIKLPAPFAVKEMAPVVVEVAGEGTLTLTFSPTVANKRETADLVLTTDDPAKPTATIAVAGTGVQAVATVTPSPVDFGDVYVTTTKKVTLTVKNTGTSELKIQRVELEPGTTAAPVITTALAPLAVNLVAGAEASTDVTFAPLSVGDEVKGGIRLFLDPSQGGEQLIAFKGRAIRASPQLCFQRTGEGTATCTDAEATSGAGSAINLIFPPTCDNELHPSGPGACTNEAGSNPGTRTAKVWVKNAGNVPVKYALQFVTNAAANKNPCGLAAAPASDFSFSNSPAPGTAQWTEPTTQLPAAATDPMPWETAPITVTYQARSRCSAGAADDTADQARITLTRQGDAFPPPALFISVTGTSKLPKPVPSTLSPNGVVPLTTDFYGVANAGSAPFNVTGVKLQEVVPETDGGVRFVDCGVAVVDDGGLACDHYSWAQPPSLPTAVPAPALVGGLNKVVLGKITFGVGADGGVVLNKPYKVNARVSTDDPYTPVVNSDVTGKAL